MRQTCFHKMLVCGLIILLTVGCASTEKQLLVPREIFPPHVAMPTASKVVSQSPAPTVPNRLISERYVAHFDSTTIRSSLKVSPDNRRVAYVVIKGDKQFVVVDGKKGKEYDGILEGSLIFGPDSKRLAYAAGVGNKQFVVVDGKEGKEYDGILKGTPIFSPDSNRVAHSTLSRRVANDILEDKWSVVVDGK